MLKKMKSQVNDLSINLLTQRRLGKLYIIFTDEFAGNDTRFGITFFDSDFEGINSMNSIIMEMLRRANLTFQDSDHKKGSLVNLLEEDEGLQRFYTSIMYHHNKKVLSGKEMFDFFFNLMNYDTEERLAKIYASVRHLYFAYHIQPSPLLISRKENYQINLPHTK